MKSLLVIISMSLLFSCVKLTPRTAVTSEYRDKKIRDVKLTVVNLDSYESLIAKSDSSIDLELMPLNLRRAIKKQSYFTDVRYEDVKSIDSLELRQLHLPGNNSFAIFLPKDGASVELDSEQNDFVLFAFGSKSSLDIVESNQIDNSQFNKPIEVKTPLGIKKISGPKLSNQYRPDIEYHSTPKFQFALWDNKVGRIVTYGNLENIWRYKQNRLEDEVARQILLKSPFYKPTL